MAKTRKQKQEAPTITDNVMVEAPSENIVTLCINAARSLAQTVKGIQNARKRYDASAAFAVLAINAATYILGISRAHVEASAEQLTAVLDKAKRLFNAPILAAVPKGRNASIRTTLSQIFRVVLSPVTQGLYGAAWEAGEYGKTHAPAPGADAIRLTLREGLNALKAATPPLSTVQQATLWGEKMLKDAADRDATITAIIAALEALRVVKVAAKVA